MREKKEQKLSHGLPDPIAIPGVPGAEPPGGRMREGMMIQTGRLLFGEIFLSYALGKNPDLTMKIEAGR